MDGLTTEQIDRFVDDGFVRLDGAFPREIADVGRALLWERTGCDPHDRSTWTRPVVRLGGYWDAPFHQAAGTARLHTAFDQLVGVDRWRPLQGLGTWPVRFPHDEEPGDDGWHVEGSFPIGDGYGLNARSDGRALLLLFLFSDVGPDDAPTRVRVGSHHDIPPLLAPTATRALSSSRSHPRRWPPPNTGRWPTRRARRATSTSAIRSSCTPANPIGGPRRSSWRNHRCSPQAASTSRILYHPSSG